MKPDGLTIDDQNYVSWDRLRSMCEQAPEYLGEGTTIWGIPRGGTHVAQMLSETKGCQLVESPLAADIIVDDLIDSGATVARFEKLYPEKGIWVPIDKRRDNLWSNRWVVFPWEMHQQRDDDVTHAARLLQALGVDVSSDGMRETPARLLRSLRELTDGYGADVKQILSTTFDAKYDEMIVVKDIEFWSLCEHHVLPFHGTVTVGYIPRERVVGLSKLARLVKAHSRRLQIQERLTGDIADDIVKYLKTDDAACVVTASHLCMEMRGVQTPATMVTSSLLGAFRDPTVRAEFLALARG